MDKDFTRRAPARNGGAREGGRKPVEVVERREPKESVFKKSEGERKFLKKLQHQLGKSFGGSKWSKKVVRPIPVYDKIILYLGRKGTRSVECGQADIPAILRRHKDDLVKYQWLHKTYMPDELPFWQPKVKGGASIRRTA